MGQWILVAAVAAVSYAYDDRLGGRRGEPDCSAVFRKPRVLRACRAAAGDVRIARRYQHRAVEAEQPARHGAARCC